MRHIIDLLIADFQERPLPDLVRRSRSVVEVKGKAIAVVGARRAGKTWFCYQRMSGLLDQGLSKERILYLNFEDDRLLPFATTDFQAILEAYYSRFPMLTEERCYFFLDEIQRVKGWENFVRRLLDTVNVTVWITGSSSKLLSREIATSLRGRSLTVEVFPLSFAEFLLFHAVDVPPGERFGTRSRARLQHAAKRYLQWGGYPEIQGVENVETRRQILRSYLDVALLRDVIERHRIGNVVALRDLVRQVMAAPATRFSVNKFYNSLRSRGGRCTKNNLYEFIEHLSDAYLTYPVPIHSRSEKARQVNPQKIYVVDAGLIESSSSGMTEDRGARLENMLYLHCRSQGLFPEYYVTESGAEVDFVVPGRKPSDRRLVQACWSLRDPLTRSREIRGIRSAMTELNLKRSTIVTWDEEGAEEGIEIVPAWKWLLRDL